MDKAEPCAANVQEEDETLKRIGVQMQEVVLSLHKAYRPVLLRYNIPQDVLDDWSRRADEGMRPLLRLFLQHITEIRRHLEFRTKNPRVCARFHFCCARRRAGEGLPALPLLKNDEEDEIHYSETNKPTLRVSHDHPSAIVMYHKPEEARSAWEKRRKSSGIKPESLIRKIWNSKRHSEGKVDV